MQGGVQPVGGIMMQRKFSLPFVQSKVHLTAGLTGKVALNQGSTTIPMGPFGEFHGSVPLNIRAAKIFTVDDSSKSETNALFFKVTNSSANVTPNYLTGASMFGVALDLLAQRVLRLQLLFLVVK
jgi:hypothetical protein